VNRRNFLKSALVSSGGLLNAQNRKPNIIVILADDLGYGDLGCYGSQIATPNLDRMATEGMRFEDFYSANSVCSPARASLMTGRYAARFGLPGVLLPGASRGIPESEVTLAQLLHDAGYVTGCMGKWHMGNQPRFMPNARGFDEYFGVPYSNDMDPLPLFHNRDLIESETSNDLLTQRFTQAAVDFIERSKAQPFFLYLAHCAPHIPIGVSPAFAGKSGLGDYGDAVQELDWSVGRVLAALADNGLDDHTIVIFSSDNGPWYQGSPGRLRGRKGESYEGGMRVPMIARMPGRIPAGTLAAGMASHLDLLPTLTTMAGAGQPWQPLDGVDITSLLEARDTPVERDVFLFLDGYDVQCARFGNFKLHLSRCDEPPWLDGIPEGRTNLPLERPELYDVGRDPSESYELGLQKPLMVARIKARVEDLIRTFPLEVRNAWRDTQFRRTRWTPTGAYPSKVKP
jgi:arylsulfatase